MPMPYTLSRGKNMHVKGGIHGIVLKVATTCFGPAKRGATRNTGTESKASGIVAPRCKDCGHQGAWREGQVSRCPIIPARGPARHARRPPGAGDNRILWTF